MSDFYSLGASWVFSFQPVLPPDFRPLFHLTTEMGLAIDAVTGTRLWLLVFPSPECFALCRVAERSPAAVVERFLHFAAYPQVM
jgi:hypothetical protein